MKFETIYFPLCRSLIYPHPGFAQPSFRRCTVNFSYTNINLLWFIREFQWVKCAFFVSKNINLQWFVRVSVRIFFFLSKNCFFWHWELSDFRHFFHYCFSFEFHGQVFNTSNTSGSGECQKWNLKKVTDSCIATLLTPKQCVWGRGQGLLFKGSVSRDFLPLFFPMIRTHLGPW